MTAPATPRQLAALVQEQQAAEAAELEGQVAEQADGGAGAELAALLAVALAAWVAAFGALTAAGTGVKLASLLANVRADVDRAGQGLGRRSQRALEDALADATRLGARHAAGFLSRASGRDHAAPDVDVSETVLDAARGLADAVTTQLRLAARLLSPRVVSGSGWRGVVLGLAAARRAVTLVRQTIAWAVHRAINDGAAQTATHYGARGLWVAEPDACFIGSTRVLAPSVLADGPAAATIAVSQHVLQGLPSNPAAPDVGLGGDARLLAATALAIPLRDRFRQVNAVTSRYYVGKIATIRTASGKELTGTPNHPIATSRGWVALAELKVGDHVFSRSRREGGIAGVHPDDDDIPPAIEQVAEAFPFTARVVPTAPEDFHGDGAGSDVHVVRTDGFLLSESDSALPQHVDEKVLDGRDVELQALAGGSLLDLGFEASRLSAPRSRNLDADLFPSLRAQAAGTTEVTPQDHVVAPEPSAHGVHVDAVDYGDFLGRLAGVVEPDQVIEVRHGEFRGHVYNLETREGWYLSEDIVCHNCVTCLAYAGRLADRDGRFPGGLSMDPNSRSTSRAALDGPPAHVNCRCRLVPWMPDWDTGPGSLPNLLRDQAWRSVAAGRGRPSESRAARRRAAQALLARRGLSARVRREAAATAAGRT